MGGLAKMDGKVPCKFGERRRGVSEDLRPWAEGDYCAMLWMCVVRLWWSWPAERETGREGLQMRPIIRIFDDRDSKSKRFLLVQK